MNLTHYECRLSSPLTITRRPDLDYLLAHLYHLTSTTSPPPLHKAIISIIARLVANIIEQLFTVFITFGSLSLHHKVNAVLLLLLHSN